MSLDRPPAALLRQIYLGYLTIVGSAVGLALHGDPDTYRRVTGMELQPTLRFAERLSAMGKAVWVRFVLG